ncbi:MAG TPA: protein phosphatase 2C domain-containing protein [Chloroflexia bacterium]|nr:protein phosphatase 2C domain-containing protein [Chloroflexia bacterium]
MPASVVVRTWTKSLPSRTHLDRDEDLAWSAPNGVAHVVIDGMGSARRQVAGREIGGEHAARLIGEVLSARLSALPDDLGIPDARQLLIAVVQEAGARIFHELNSAGQIAPDQIPAGRTAEDVMVAAVMTGLILCEGGRRAVIGQNGDTRAYLYSGGDLLLLTEDQDAVQSDAEAGAISPDDADAIQDALDNFDGRDLGKLDRVARGYFARRNLVFGQLGDSATPAPPVLSVIQLRPNDMLLLCSDGVYGNLTQSEIADSMALIDPAAALVDRADARSGERALPDAVDLNRPYNYRAHQDDTTALVLKVEWP